MKKGFTLSEILITMGIIGVAAALVFPNLTAKINRNTVGITLARAVELTEKGFGDILNVARENATAVGIEDPASISTLGTIQANMINPTDPQDNHLIVENNLIRYSAVRSYLGIEPVQDYNAPEGSNDVFKFKKNNTYLIYVNENINNNVFEPDTVISRIYFDTNGPTPPNAFGEDIFLFGLTDSGHLVPAGSAAFRNNIWNNGNLNIHELNFRIPNADPNETCIGDAIPSPEDQDEEDEARLSCTARVVQDGWKINYSY